jgi:predicted nucleic acid-binding protein
VATFIVDASATLPWCLKDEETVWTMAILRRLNTGDEAIVPAHWPNEVSNALLSASRRGRIPFLRTNLFWDELAQFPINIEPPISPNLAKSILSLCDQYRLTFYDATYLELAQRLALPLATLDDDLRRAASLAGVALIV